MSSRFFLPSIKLFTRIKAAMDHKFQKYPSLSNALTGGVMFASGEFVTQRILPDEDSALVKAGRVFEIGVLGFLMNGFFLTRWYRLLDAVVGISMKCNRTVVIKVVADQLLYAPFCIFAFFGYTAVIRHNNITDMKNYFVHKNQHSFWSTYMTDCSIWPVANYLCFKVIPFHYRATWTSVVQFAWQIYMSYVSKETMEEDEQPQPQQQLVL